MKSFGVIFTECFLLCIICFSLFSFMFSGGEDFFLPLLPAIIAAFFISTFYVLKTKIEALEKSIAQLTAQLEKYNGNNQR